MSKKTRVIIGIVLLLTVVGGFWYKTHQNKQIDGSALMNKDRKLTSEQQKIYLDRIKLAEENLQAIKPSDPKYHISQVNDYMYLGQQYFGLGQLDKAKQNYLKVLEIDSNNESALVG